MAFDSSPKTLTLGKEYLGPIWLNMFLFDDAEKSVYGNSRCFNDFCQ